MFYIYIYIHMHVCVDTCQLRCGFFEFVCVYYWSCLDSACVQLGCTGIMGIGWCVQRNPTAIGGSSVRPRRCCFSPVFTSFNVHTLVVYALIKLHFAWYSKCFVSYPRVNSHRPCQRKLNENTWFTIFCSPSALLNLLDGDRETRQKSDWWFGTFFIFP